MDKCCHWDFKKLKFKKNDEVIIPSLTFVACANVVEIAGAKVVFADVDPKTLLFSIDDCLKNNFKNKSYYACSSLWEFI